MGAVENFLHLRPARRVNSHAAATSKDRGINTVTFIDFEKVPKRFVIYGQLLLVSLVLKEWDPAVETFWMGQGDREVTADNPAYDASAPVISRYRDGACVWETCIQEQPKSSEARAATKCRELDAAMSGAKHRIFTRLDGLAAAVRFENCLFLNSLIQRVPMDRFTCRIERRILDDVLSDEGCTSLDDLLGKRGIDVAKMLASVGRAIHTGRVTADLNLEPIHLLTPLTTSVGVTA
ncbi:hypothetical protein [Paraburkholderia sp. RL17-337-BIB-A]|uniref:hypothetical protein n=1 Tax=Paraburkholderia sp. RL17-337-BIB-A TaxID=3031636 RepID=UPI0038B76D99